MRVEINPQTTRNEDTSFTFPVMLTPTKTKDQKSKMHQSISGSQSGSSAQKMSVRRERLRRQIQNMNSMRAQKDFKS